MQTGQLLRNFVGHTDEVTSVAFSADGKTVLTGSTDTTSKLWDAATGRELCTLISFDDGTWAVTDPDGRFDTNDLERAGNLHWVLPDDPFHALPVTVFLRQYYEPHLMARILAGEKLPPVPSIATLNRMQPAVTVAAPSRADADGGVTLNVTVQRGSGSVIVGGQTVPLTSADQWRDGAWQRGTTSGVFDLRVFRDGHLVAYRDGEIPLGPDGTATLSFPGIRLPHASAGEAAASKPITFSAYCFNVDQVKSETGYVEYTPPPPPAATTPAVRQQRMAYVVTMGVNASEAPGYSLRFAVNDADRLAAQLRQRLAGTGAYTHIVPVELTAPAGATDPSGVSATKADLHAVLDRLAGHPLTAEEQTRLAQRIPGADKLAAATPDDLVVLAFSGHGEAGEGSVPVEHGRFYLLPYDVGSGFDLSPGNPEVRTASLARCISSDELTLWLRDVDAGEMALIVDACHSAAAVEGAPGEFKPGPMGARGLGQLAYEKGMRVLAATQSDSVALEMPGLGGGGGSSGGQGLLSYALSADGLEAGKADWQPKDNRIGLSEWLGYAVEDVPTLWQDVLAKRRGAVYSGTLASDVVARGRFVSAVRVREDLQRPQLFDFHPASEADPVIGLLAAAHQ
jgi:hypothetical protein